MEEHADNLIENRHDAHVADLHDQHQFKEQNFQDSHHLDLLKMEYLQQQQEEEPIPFNQINYNI